METMHGRLSDMSSEILGIYAVISTLRKKAVWSFEEFWKVRPFTAISRQTLLGMEQDSLLSLRKDTEGKITEISLMPFSD